jgi:hypothetical protein
MEENVCIICPEVHISDNFPPTAVISYVSNSFSVTEILYGISMHLYKSFIGITYDFLLKKKNQ